MTDIILFPCTADADAATLVQVIKVIFSGSDAVMSLTLLTQHHLDACKKVFPAYIIMCHTVSLYISPYGLLLV